MLNTLSEFTDDAVNVRIVLCVNYKITIDVESAALLHFTLANIQ